MASVRSMGATKPTENLLSRRFNRTSTSTAILPERKLVVSKTTSFPVATTIPSIRQKSSRLSLKKSSIEPNIPSPRLKSSSLTISADSTEITNDKMSSTTFYDLPLIKSTAKNIRPTSYPKPNKTLEQSTDITPAPSVQVDNTHFTLQSFDTIRTVGTGKSQN